MAPLDTSQLLLIRQSKDNTLPKTVLECERNDLELLVPK